MQCPKCGYPGAAINGDCPRCNQNESRRGTLTAPPVQAPVASAPPKPSRAGLWQGLAIAGVLAAVVIAGLATRPKPPVAPPPASPAPVETATTPEAPAPSPAEATASPTPVGQPQTTTAVEKKAMQQAPPPPPPAKPVVAKLPSQDPKSSALFKAINLGRTDLVKDMLRKDKSAASMTDKDGKTPLHWVAETSEVPVSKEVRRELAALLLNAGADPNARARDTGETPLIAAAWNGNDAALMAEALLTAGADVNAVARSSAEADAMTALAIAQTVSAEEFIRVLRKFKVHEG